MPDLELDAQGFPQGFETVPEREGLSPFQEALTKASVMSDGSTDFWIKEKIDRHTMLSVGSQITADMAIMRMFNEHGRIDGGSG